MLFGVRPPDGEIKFADEFSFKMDVSYPQQYEISPDTSSLGNAYFDVLGFEFINDVSSGTLKTSSWKVHAQAFCVETSTFPAIAWKLFENGKAVSVAKSPEFKIKALPLFNPEEVKSSDIKDVYPPLKFPHWLLIILAVIAAAAFGVYVYRKLTEKNIITFGKVPWKDTRTPYQRAYDRSMMLENSTLLEREKYKEFYTGLVSVFRFYLHEEYGIDADLMTTKDLARQMKESGIGIVNISKSRNFLNMADLVKFAKMKPENVNNDIKAMRSLLQELDLEHTPSDIGASAFPSSQDIGSNPGSENDYSAKSEADYSRFAPPSGYGMNNDAENGRTEEKL
ncbi:MAG: hypothetical protein J5706_04035 [Elusimicrobiales bacterium]|nr:hypothetical protein [Elusimicrobiales bacterium]